MAKNRGPDQPNGKPIDPSDDWADWKHVLRLAGVRDARVHDGRHTAATMLLLQGVDEQTVMAIMGWSDRRMVSTWRSNRWRNAFVAGAVREARSAVFAHET